MLTHTRTHARTHTRAQSHITHTTTTHYPPLTPQYAASFLRINLLVTCVALAMGQPWMLYYICGLHTLWTGYVYILHMTRQAGGRASGLSSVPLVWRYGTALALNALLWHFPSLFYLVMSPFTPLLSYEGSLYEVRWAGTCACA